MEIILLEKIRNLGNVGDRVKVKHGFARNYLIPESKAVFATPANIAEFESKRAIHEKKAQDTFVAAQEKAARLNEINLTISAIASDEGKLYGSVGINEIRDALKAQGMDVDKREIILSDGAFHSVGNFVVEVLLHSDVVANVKLDIVPA